MSSFVLASVVWMCREGAAGKETCDHMDVSAPAGDPIDPLRLLMEEIDAISRRRTYKQDFEGIRRS